LLVNSQRCTAHNITCLPMHRPQINLATPHNRFARRLTINATLGTTLQQQPYRAYLHPVSQVSDLLLPCQGFTQQKGLLQLLPASLCGPQVKQQLEGLAHVVCTVWCCTSFSSSITGDDLAAAAAAAARGSSIQACSQWPW
jgi:hypothetical protein